MTLETNIKVIPHNWIRHLWCLEVTGGYFYSSKTMVKIPFQISSRIGESEISEIVEKLAMKDYLWNKVLGIQNRTKRWFRISTYFRAHFDCSRIEKWILNRSCLCVIIRVYSCMQTRFHRAWFSEIFSNFQKKITLGILVKFRAPYKLSLQLFSELFLAKKYIFKIKRVFYHNHLK